MERLTGIVYLVNNATGRGLVRDPKRPEAFAFNLSAAPIGIKAGWTVTFTPKLDSTRGNHWAEDLEHKTPA